MNFLQMLATLGELAAAIDAGGGSGPGAVEQINAFVEGAKGQRVIALFDQLLDEAGLKIVIAIRK